ncbi:MAG: sugar phosphate nucleotidyltransferase [bacterium]
MAFEISNVSSAFFQKTAKAEKKHEQVENKATVNQKELVSSQGAHALKSMALSTISFKGDGDNSRVVDIFEGDTQLGQSKVRSYEPKKEKDWTEPKAGKKPDKIYAPLTVEWDTDTRTRERKVYVTDIDGNVVATAKKKTDNNKVTVKAMTGASGKAIRIEIPNPNKPGKNIVLICKAGSEVKTDDVQLNMPSAKKQVSFAGKLVVLTSYKAEELKNDVEGSFDKGIFNAFEKQYQKNHAKFDKFNFLSTAGGFGTRTNDITLNEMCKPSIAMADGSHLIDNSLAMGVKGGVIAPDTKPEFSKEVGKAGNAGAVYQAIEKDPKLADKPAIICSADAFSDFEITEALDEFNAKEADLMIVGIPVPPDHVSGFGIIGMDDDKNIQKFIEKPKNLEAAEMGLIKEGKHKGEYLANTAIYIASPKFLKSLAEHHPEEGEYDFGKDAIPGALKDGLKVVAHVAHGNWDDFGTSNAIIQGSRDVVNGKYHVPNEVKKNFEKNVDKQTGVVYTGDNSRAVVEDYLAQSNGSIKGNILVIEE